MKAAYQHKIAEGELESDQGQFVAVNALDTLINTIEQQGKGFIREPTFFSKIKVALHNLIFSNKHRKTLSLPVKGIYFYGRVGRGKTMLMDFFYQKLTIKRKRRIHFYRFMADVHQELAIISASNKLKTNPLEQIAKRWSNEVQVLCFDEFFVVDIGDAMILAGLFEALFNYGVIIVTTSNCHPEQLYKNGLQRERFLPTIEQIKKHCQIISIDGDIDHRLSDESCDKAKRYFLVTENGNVALEQHFTSLMPSEYKAEYHGRILVCNREIDFLRRAKKVIWFDFFALCSGTRSQLDYIDIANNYQTIFISNVPQFSGRELAKISQGVEDNYQRKGQFLNHLQALDDEARRFIALVDEFYDRSIQLVVSAEVSIDELYKGKVLAFEFARCQSRLHEMQNTNH